MAKEGNPEGEISPPGDSWLKYHCLAEHLLLPSPSCPFGCSIKDQQIFNSPNPCKTACEKAIPIAVSPKKKKKVCKACVKGGHSLTCVSHGGDRRKADKNAANISCITF